MAASEDDLAEIGLGVDALLVQHQSRHIVAGGRIGVHQTKVLTLEIGNGIVGAVFLHIEDGVIALRTIGVHVNAESFDLDAGDQSAGEGRRAVAGDMNIPGALPFDHGGIVIGDAQVHLHAEHPRQIIHERRVAINDARGVLGRDDGEGQFRIFRAPILGERTACAGDEQGGGEG